MKKKMTAYILLAALVTASLAGCGKKDDEVKAPVAEAIEETVVDETEKAVSEPETEVADESEDEVVKPESKEEEKAETVDYEAIYKDLLDEYYVLINCPIDLDETKEGQAGITEASWIMDDAASSIGYAIRDLSGDGIPELTIAAIPYSGAMYPSAEVYALFTCVNEKPQFVFEGWARNLYFWLGDGRFYNSGSNGAMYSLIGTYKLKEDGTALDCEDFYFTYEKDESYEEVGFYHNTTGVYDKAAAEEMDVSLEDFWAIDEKILEGVAPFELTPFSEYAYDGVLPEKKSADISENPFSVYYAEDVMAETVVEFEADKSEYQKQVLFRMDDNAIVKDFAVNKLMLTDYVDNKMVFDEEQIYYMGDFDPAADFVLKMTFFGDTPSYGISFVDESGNTRKFAIGMSGFDGSVMLEEY